MPPRFAATGDHSRFVTLLSDCHNCCFLANKCIHTDTWFNNSLLFVRKVFDRRSNGSRTPLHPVLHHLRTVRRHRGRPGVRQHLGEDQPYRQDDGLRRQSLPELSQSHADTRRHLSVPMVVDGPLRRLGDDLCSAGAAASRLRVFHQPRRRVQLLRLHRHPAAIAPAGGRRRSEGRLRQGQQDAGNVGGEQFDFVAFRRERKSTLEDRELFLTRCSKAAGFDVHLVLFNHCDTLLNL